MGEHYPGELLDFYRRIRVALGMQGNDCEAVAQEAERLLALVPTLQGGRDLTIEELSEKLVEARAEVERLREAARPLLAEAARLARREYLPEAGCSLWSHDRCSDAMAEASMRIRDIHDTLVHEVTP